MNIIINNHYSTPFFLFSLLKNVTIVSHLLIAIGCNGKSFFMSVLRAMKETLNSPILLYGLPSIQNHCT